MKTELASNIPEYFEQMLKVPMTATHIQLLKEGFPFDSECGQAAIKIINYANLFMQVCDPAVHPQIISAAQHAIEIVCFG